MEESITERTSSARELARRIGVSHTSIQRAERAGRIAREADGDWDVEASRR
jgi:transcriptional regulator of aromatic amino acid metabolism